MTDFAIYGVHVACMAAFVTTRAIAARRQPKTAEPAAAAPATSPYSRTLVFIHALAFGVLYFGLGNAVIGHRVPTLFAGQRIVGAAIIVLATALPCWALLHFTSWRFRAQLEAGHKLATQGPFALVRHPIYLSLDLFALGSAIWVPTPTLWVAVVLMCIGSDLRARAEERLLLTAFGEAYRDYMKKTSRTVPGIY